MIGNNKSNIISVKNIEKLTDEEIDDWVEIIKSWDPKNNTIYDNTLFDINDIAKCVMYINKKKSII